MLKLIGHANIMITQIKRTIPTIILYHLIWWNVGRRGLLHLLTVIFGMQYQCALCGLFGEGKTDLRKIVLLSFFKWMSDLTDLSSSKLWQVYWLLHFFLTLMPFKLTSCELVSDFLFQLSLLIYQMPQKSS